MRRCVRFIIISICLVMMGTAIATAGLLVKSIQTSQSSITPGQKGIVVTVSLKNTGPNSVNVQELILTFNGGTGGYEVTPTVNNPEIIAAGAQEIFYFTVNASYSISPGSVVIDLIPTGIDQVTGEVVRNRNPLGFNWNMEFDEDDDGVPDGWSDNITKGMEDTVTSDSSTFDGSTKSLKISNANGGNVWAWAQNQKITVKPGRQYIVTSDIKIQDVVSTSYKAAVIVYWHKTDDTYASRANDVFFQMSGTYDWHSVESPMVLAPDDAVKATLSCSLWKAKGGIAWFDNVILWEIIPTEQPGSWTVSKPATLEVGTIIADRTTIIYGEQAIVSMEVLNIGEAVAFIDEAGLTFKGYPGGYLVTPEPSNPTSIEQGKRAVFNFSVQPETSSLPGGTYEIGGYAVGYDAVTGDIVNSLLKNGGMEHDSNNNGIPDHWEDQVAGLKPGDYLGIDQTEKTSGQQSLKLYNSGKGSISCMASNNRISVEAGSRYIITSNIKTDSVCVGDDYTAYGATVAVYFYNAAIGGSVVLAKGTKEEGVIGGTYQLFGVKGTTNWKRYVGVITVPEGATHAQIGAMLWHGNNSVLAGSAWYDDLTFTKIAMTPAIWSVPEPARLVIKKIEVEDDLSIISRGQKIAVSMIVENPGDRTAIITEDTLIFDAKWPEEMGYQLLKNSENPINVGPGETAILDYDVWVTGEAHLGIVQVDGYIKGIDELTRAVIIDNIVYNGNMELDLNKNGIPDGWESIYVYRGRGEISLDPDSVEGKYALKVYTIYSKMYLQNSFNFASSVKDKKYRFSAKVKYKDISQDKFGAIWLSYTDPAGYVAQFKGTGGYGDVGFPFTAIDNSIMIRLFIESGVRSTIWFDDIVIPRGALEIAQWEVIESSLHLQLTHQFKKGSNPLVNSGTTSVTAQYKVENISDDEIQDLVLTNKFSDVANYKLLENASQGSVSYDPITKIFTWEIGELEGHDLAWLNFEIEVTPTEEQIYDLVYIDEGIEIRGNIIEDKPTTPPILKPIGATGFPINTESVLGLSNRGRVFRNQMPSIALEVYDLSGNLIHTILKTKEIGGHYYEHLWDGKLEGGRYLPSGAYILNLSTKDGLVYIRDLTTAPRMFNPGEQDLIINYFLDVKNDSLNSDKVSTTFFVGRGMTTHVQDMSVIGNPLVAGESELVVSVFLPEITRISVNLYSVSGYLVRKLCSPSLESGNWSIAWDGTNDYDQLVKAGVYILRIIVEDPQSGEKFLHSVMVGVNKRN